MFKIEKRFTFEAANRLPHHGGKCARLHGHSFQLMVTLSSNSLHKSGSSVDMLEDFGDISKAVKPLLDDFLDHHYLNETLGLENPTSEKIAEWVFQCLFPILPTLIQVTVQETCTCSASYTILHQGDLL